MPLPDPHLQVFLLNEHNSFKLKISTDTEGEIFDITQDGLLMQGNIKICVVCPFRKGLINVSEEQKLLLSCLICAGASECIWKVNDGSVRFTQALIREIWERELSIEDLKIGIETNWSKDESFHRVKFEILNACLSGLDGHPTALNHDIHSMEQLDHEQRISEEEGGENQKGISDRFKHSQMALPEQDLHLRRHRPDLIPFIPATSSSIHFPSGGQPTVLTPIQKYRSLKISLSKTVQKESSQRQVPQSQVPQLPEILSGNLQCQSETADLQAQFRQREQHVSPENQSIFVHLDRLQHIEELTRNLSSDLSDTQLISALLRPSDHSLNHRSRGRKRSRNSFELL